MADSPPQRLEGNTKADRHGDGECPILSCDYGRPPNKKRLRHYIFVHLRTTHQITMPLRPKSGFKINEHNKACLEHFLEWADEHDVEHEAEKFFKYALEKRKTGPRKNAHAQTGMAAGASGAALPTPPPSRAPYQPAFQAGIPPGASGIAFPPLQAPYQPVFQAHMAPGAFSVGPPLPKAPYQPASALPAPIVPAGTPWYAHGAAHVAPNFGPPLPRGPYQPANSMPAPPVQAPPPWYGERRAPLLYSVSTEELDEVMKEEAEHIDVIPDDADYGQGAGGNPELSHIISQLRAGSRSLISTPPNFRSFLAQGLHQQLIDVFVSALGGRASDLRHDSAYRSLLLALLIMHASDPRTKDLASFLIEQTKEYRSWLTRQTKTCPDYPHHFYKHCCGTYRALDGFFDVMYGIYVNISMRSNWDTVLVIDFPSIVTEVGGEQEAMHAADFRDQYQELLNNDYEVLKNTILKAVQAWLVDYEHSNQAFFQHLIFELDAEEESKDRRSRGLEV